MTIPHAAFSFHHSATAAYQEGVFIKSKTTDQKDRRHKEYDSVVISAVTTLTFLILLEGLLGPEFKRQCGKTIVSFAILEIMLDIFVISPEIDLTER
ncbi:hypothetical protein [Alicyclobacillus sp. SO9]|uniref:hypothetical protein n=1 Tax=Alicyclobacillus sp. SO9 TaxID=2665646 RepID=UPI0018E7FF76|nr:hypothetical protein [Alicyclobacillus sp. SO9]QQE77637.1 hypothetical protein GI364_17085 [Alicyclobacillus sp. SO9]